MIFENGECSLSRIDDANIPVDIWLTNAQKKAEDNEETLDPDIRDAGGWTLTAANYCPRKGRACEDAQEKTHRWPPGADHFFGRLSL